MPGEAGGGSGRSWQGCLCWIPSCERASLAVLSFASAGPQGLTVTEPLPAARRPEPQARSVRLPCSIRCHGLSLVLSGFLLASFRNLPPNQAPPPPKKVLGVLTLRRGIYQLSPPARGGSQHSNLLRF